jgi:hypothetical protein
MKNIHLIQTDKPSRLVKNGNNKLYFTIQTLPLDEDIYCYPQNIYITSDEEIKEGEWVIQINFEKTNTQIIKCQTESQTIIANSKNGSFTKNKIILTTDQDLIKDGVQAIDDDFLEWFVKNPSCEYVKTDLVPVNEFGSEITVNSYGFDKFKYKIIIPKEDWLLNNPQCKQIESCSKSLSKKCICPKEEPKQETLEDYIIEVTKNFKDKMSIKFTSGGIKLGAKWQAKRMYSEEDMKKCWDACLDFNKPAGFDNGIPFNEFLNNLKTNKNY